MKIITLISTLLALVLPLSARAEDGRFLLIGSISQDVSKGHAVGIVVLKDSKTKRTIPVQIGEVFEVDGKVYRVKSVTKEGALISDGKSLSTMARPDTTASFGQGGAAPIPRDVFEEDRADLVERYDEDEKSDRKNTNRAGSQNGRKLDRKGASNPQKPVGSSVERQLSSPAVDQEQLDEEPSGKGGGDLGDEGVDELREERVLTDGPQDGGFVIEGGEISVQDEEPAQPSAAESTP